MKRAIAGICVAVLTAGVAPAEAAHRPVARHAAPSGDRVGTLFNTDIDPDSGAGCGLYLHRNDGDLILFDAYGPYASMKIGGRVVHLFGRPVARKGADLVTYTADDGRIQVIADTHVTERYSAEASASAGTLTVHVAGTTEVIAVSGEGGC